MTREILFHGKRCDNGEWVEGYYVYDESGQTTEEPTAYICHLNQHPCGWMLIPYKVFPESVGQWTGMNDRNGRKIFEGDVVRTQPCSDRPYSKKAKFKEHIGVVRYCIRHFKNSFHEQDYEAEWVVDIKDRGEYGCYDWSMFFKCEVIGTVFDNADLLEG